MIRVTDSVFFYDPDKEDTWPNEEKDGEFVLCRMVDGGLGKGRYPFEVCATKAFKTKRNDVDAWTHIPNTLVNVKKSPVCCVCNKPVSANGIYTVLIGKTYCFDCIKAIIRKKA